MFSLGLAELQAIVLTVICAGSLYLTVRPKSATLLRVSTCVLFVIAAFAMFEHVFPGFHNIRIFDKVTFTPDAIPFTMYVNFDKLLVGIFLYVFWIRKNDSGTFALSDLRTVALTAGLLILLFLPIATAVGYVRFDPKVPELAWAWALNNLFIVCFAEEALFRGFIQKGLLKLVENRVGNGRFVVWQTISVSAILFGADHYKGGLTYIIFATIAGLFYGYAYQRTGKIAAPILVHFILNATHFFLFTYPALAH